MASATTLIPQENLRRARMVQLLSGAANNRCRTLDVQDITFSRRHDEEARNRTERKTSGRSERNVHHQWLLDQTEYDPWE